MKLLLYNGEHGIVMDTECKPEELARAVERFDNEVTINEWGWHWEDLRLWCNELDMPFTIESEVGPDEYPFNPTKYDAILYLWANYGGHDKPTTVEVMNAERFSFLEETTDE
jgi:hypothetical protein